MDSCSKLERYIQTKSYKDDIYFFLPMTVDTKFDAHTAYMETKRGAKSAGKSAPEPEGEEDNYWIELIETLTDISGILTGDDWETEEKWMELRHTLGEYTTMESLTPLEIQNRGWLNWEINDWAAFDEKTGGVLAEAKAYLAKKKLEKAKTGCRKLPPPKKKAKPVEQEEEDPNEPLNLRVVYESVKRACRRIPQSGKLPDGQKATVFGEAYAHMLEEHVAYECNNPTFRSLERFYLGEFELACYDDDYDRDLYDKEKVNIFVTAHRKTGLYIITLAIHDNHFAPTQLIDQMSTRHLEIFAGDVNDAGEEIPTSIEDYMQERFHLVSCGESKCVICMSNRPAHELELAYILAGETSVSEHIDYHLHPNRVEPLLKNHACYDYYESYISRSVIAFVFDDYPENLFFRLDDEASVLFVVEIVLFQNSAVLRTNRRVVEELGESDGITNSEIEELYMEFGQTMAFWSTDVFKYPFSQKEAEEVIESFGIDKALEEYYRNQTFIDRLIEIKGNIANEIADTNMNTILYFLAWCEGGAGLLSALVWGASLFIDDLDEISATVSLFFLFLTLAFILWFLLVKGGLRRWLHRRQINGHGSNKHMNK